MSRSAYREAAGEVWKHGEVGDLIGDGESIRNRNGRNFSLTFFSASSSPVTSECVLSELVGKMTIYRCVLLPCRLAQ